LFSDVELGRYSRQAKFDGAFFNDQKTWGASVEANKDLGGLTLTSITAYREFEVTDNNDGDGTSLAMVNVNSADQKQTQFTEELRIASPAGQRFEYVAGFFYFDQDVDTITGLKGNFGNVLPAGAFFQNTIDRGISTRNWAAFGQGTFHVTDSLRLIGGLRYTNERLKARFLRTIDPAAAGPMPGLGGPFLNAPDIRAKDSDVSYKLGAQYNLDPATMVYATYSRGYKGQAINLLNNLSALSLSSGAAVLKPEIVKNYEAGLRSSPFGRRATFNLTLFDTEFENFQASTFDPVTISFTLLNAGKLRSRGAELEAQLSPVRGLRLGANVAYADTKVWNFFPACYPGQTLALGCGGASQNVSGSSLANAPLWSYTLSADYRRELENAPFDLTAGVTYSYRSSVFFVYRDPNAVQPGYGLVNVNLGLQTKDGRYEVTGFVRNLFDKHFVSATGTGFRDSNATGAGYTQTLTQDAFRRVGVELRAHF
jgi:iron complex outermembrane receptor protein